MKLPKILLLLAIGYWLLAIIASPVLAAAEVSTGGSLGNFQQALEEPGTSLQKWIGGEELVDPEGTTGVLPSVANGLTTMGIGKLPTQEQIQQILQQQPTTYKPGGAIGGVNNLIVAMYDNRPASSKQYFADLGRNLGIVKPAYAQAGIGFQGLTPILPLWKAFRNIAYLFFTIIFVVMGFAIMFRMKLDPQTVISIQNAIPRVVIALILVTFSYAIAGLLIDLIYILIGLGVLVIAPVGGLNVVSEQQKYMGLNFFEGVGLLIGGGIQTLLKVQVGQILAVLIGVLGALISGQAVALLGGVALFLLIFTVFALYVIFKLFLSLLDCYISIIISIVFSPLQIMLGVLPGSQMGFGNWFKNLLANVLVFPAVALFMLLGWVITTKAVGPSWVPPVVSIGGGSLVVLIGFGMLFTVNKVPNKVKEALGLKPSTGAIENIVSTLSRVAGVGALQISGQDISNRYKKYKPGTAPPSLATANAVMDTLRSLGIIK